MTGVSIRSRERHAYTCTKRDGEGDGGACKPRKARHCGHHQVLARGKEGFFSDPESERQPGPAETLIKGFYLPEV